MLDFESFGLELCGGTRDSGKVAFWLLGHKVELYNQLCPLEFRASVIRITWVALAGVAQLVEKSNVLSLLGHVSRLWVWYKSN